MIFQKIKVKIFIFLIILFILLAKLFFDYNCKAYADYMSGQDDFDELEKDLINLFRKQSIFIKKVNTFS